MSGSISWQSVKFIFVVESLVRLNDAEMLCGARWEDEVDHKFSKICRDSLQNSGNSPV